MCIAQYLTTKLANKLSGYLYLLFRPPNCESVHRLLLNSTPYSPNSTWLVTTSRLDTTCSTCRVHAFSLCRACQIARLDMLVSTRSTRRTCCVVSKRDVTSQVKFGLITTASYYGSKYSYHFTGRRYSSSF